jgi:hypothetical protein
VSLQAIWKPYGIEIIGENLSANIAGLTNYNVSDNQQMDRTSVDGNPFPTQSRVMSRDESITFTSLNVDSVIDMIGVGAQCLTMEDNGYFKIWLAQWDQCSHRPIVGAFHRYYGVLGGLSMANRGIISLQNLSCNHRADATASVKFDLIADPDGANLNVSLVQGVNQALPVALFDNMRRYTLSPIMRVGNSVLENKTGFEIAPNANVERISVDSNLAAHFARVNDHKPVITIRGIDPSWPVPAEGLACTHANTNLFLRRRGDTAGVDFEPNNVAKHLKFTAKGRAFKTQLAGGSANAPSETVLVIYPDYDNATNMVPIVATSSQLIA